MVAGGQEEPLIRILQEELVGFTYCESSPSGVHNGMTETNPYQSVENHSIDPSRPIDPSKYLGPSQEAKITESFALNAYATGPGIPGVELQSSHLDATTPLPPPDDHFNVAPSTEETSTFTVSNALYAIGWKVKNQFDPSSHANSNNEIALEDIECPTTTEEDSELNPCSTCGKAPVEALDEGGLDSFGPRLAWLVILMLLQSVASIVLDNYEAIIQKHTSIVVFLTVLVGAGGNAGSQSVIVVIRNIEKNRKMSMQQSCQILWRQFLYGLGLGLCLAVVTFLRVWISDHNSLEIMAILTSIFLIVTTSTVLSSILPMIIMLAKMDPGHAGAAVQVVMDVVGVAIVMGVSSTILS